MLAFRRAVHSFHLKPNFPLFPFFNRLRAVPLFPFYQHLSVRFSQCLPMSHWNSILALRHNPLSQFSSLFQSQPPLRLLPDSSLLSPAYYRSFSSQPDLYSDPSALDLLKSKGATGRAFTITENEPVIKAARLMTSTGVGALIVMKEGHVTGIISERDVLKHLVAVDDMSRHFGDEFDSKLLDTASIASRSSSSDALVSMHTPVRDVMTPSTKMVVATPEDPSSKCLALMLNRNIRHLPIIKDNTLLGVLSVRDMTGLLKAEDMDSSSGATKARYLTEILPRLGVPSNTKILRAESEFPLFLNSAAFVIPHPNKRATGGEDAHFMLSHIGVLDEDQNGSERPENSKPRVCALSFIGVADGVGSWTVEQGIDVSKFSRELISFCEKAAKDAVEHNWQKAMDPLHILSTAWTNINKAQLVGSSTICIIALDGTTQRVQAANLGDSGFLVLRHHSRIIAGSLHSVVSPDRSAFPHQVIFRSTQQLHSFNEPLQLGLNSKGRIVCEQPSDAEIIKLSLEEDDLVLLATDGLFDNLGESDILALIGEGTDPPNVLAEKIAKAAYAASLDTTRDGPFAILAKDNNYMWGGGHPDDITVIVSRVTAARKLVIPPPPVSKLMYAQAL